MGETGFATLTEIFGDDPPQGDNSLSGRAPAGPMNGSATPSELQIMREEIRQMRELQERHRNNITGGRDEVTRMAEQNDLLRQQNSQMQNELLMRNPGLANQQGMQQPFAVAPPPVNVGGAPGAYTQFAGATINQQPVNEFQQPQVPQQTQAPQNMAAVQARLSNWLGFDVEASDTQEFVNALRGGGNQDQLLMELRQMQQQMQQQLAQQQNQVAQQQQQRQVASIVTGQYPELADPNNPFTHQTAALYTQLVSNPSYQALYQPTAANMVTDPNTGQTYNAQLLLQAAAQAKAQQAQSFMVNTQRLNTPTLSNTRATQRPEASVPLAMVGQDGILQDQEFMQAMMNATGAQTSRQVVTQMAPHLSNNRVGI